MLLGIGIGISISCFPQITDVEALREALAELDVPAAIFHGAHDKSAALNEAKSIASNVLKHGTFVSFENSGHVPFLEETTRFNNELLAFLEG